VLERGGQRALVGHGSAAEITELANRSRRGLLLSGRSAGTGPPRPPRRRYDA